MFDIFDLKVKNWKTYRLTHHMPTRHFCHHNTENLTIPLYPQSYMYYINRAEIVFGIGVYKHISMPVYLVLALQ